MVMIKTASNAQFKEIQCMVCNGAKEGMILKRNAAEINGLIEKKNFFVAMKGKKIIGTVCLEFYSKRLSELRTIFMLKEYRSNGVGKLLVEKVMKRAKALKVQEIMFVTTDDLKPWLEKQGFGQKIHGIKPVFFKKT